MQVDGLLYRKVTRWPVVENPPTPAQPNAVGMVVGCCCLSGSGSEVAYLMVEVGADAENDLELWPYYECQVEPRPDEPVV